MCVDYQTLNQIIVKYKYHIPLIDELLDELFGDVMFFKLNLHLGYQQIRVFPGDILKNAF